MCRISIRMKRDYLAEFADEEEAVDKLESNTDKAVLATKDESVYRYDQYGALPYDNTSMYMGTNSTAYYFSLANTSISDFFGEMYLNTPWEQHYENLDGRTILDRLASVKYFVISGDNFRYLSYGYNKEKGTAGSGNGECRAYENENALPLGYTYDSYIPVGKVSGNGCGEEAAGIDGRRGAGGEYAADGFHLF